ncbi:MAG: TetR/AcrR family transcriptional regulator [Nitrospirae bacterium]|nr:MAG: TetR/AcrR family transcriptional regulator [Nitrospirota bacterium]
MKKASNSVTVDRRFERKRREREARCEEILAAAEQLFSKHGFFKTSMSEIARTAQFALGTVYRCFASKEEIYISLIERKIDDLFAQLKTALALAESATDQLRAVIRVKLAFADRNRDFFRIYVSEWSGFEWTVKSAFGERIWKKYLDQITLVAAVIQDGISRGEFRDVDPQDASLAFHGMLNATMYMWTLETNPAESLVAKEELLFSLAVQGLAKFPRNGA